MSGSYKRGTLVLHNATDQVAFSMEAIPKSPVKGSIIHVPLDTTSTTTSYCKNIFRVLSIDGNVAKLMGLFDLGKVAYSTNGYNYYNNYCNLMYKCNSWYRSLPSVPKSAIQQQTSLTQYAYTYNASSHTPQHPSYADITTKYNYTNVGSSYVYSISLDDVETYFNGSYTSADLFSFFYNGFQETYSNGIWFSDADGPTGIWNSWGCSGTEIGSARCSTSRDVRPVIIVDLTNLNYSFAEPYTITNNLINCTCTSVNQPVIYPGESTVYFNYEPNSGYNLPDTVTVTNATGTWTKSTGSLKISNATGPVTITVNADVRTEPYPINTFYVENITKSPSNPTSVPSGGSADLYFTANAGYMLPFDADVKVTNATKVWDRLTGKLTLSNATKTVYIDPMYALKIGEQSWKFNNTIYLSSSDNKTYEAIFSSNNTNFNSIRGDSTNNKLYYDDTLVYENNTWVNENYRDVTFTYFIDSNQSIYSLLTSNAICTGPFSISFSATCSSSFRSEETISYTVYDGEDTTGTVLGTVSRDNPATYICTTGKVYCKANDSDAIYNSFYSYFTGMKDYTGYNDYAYATVDPDYSSHDVCLCFDPAQYEIQFKNVSKCTVDIYDDTTGSSIGSLSSEMHWPEMHCITKNHEIILSTMYSYDYPYKSSTTTGGVTEVTHTTSSVKFKITGEGSIEVEFAKPTYQVTLTSLNDTVTFYDGDSSSGTYLCQLSKDCTQTVDVSSGKIYMETTSTGSYYDEMKSTYSGLVLYSYDNRLQVDGNGSASVYYYTPKDITVYNNGGSSITVYDGNSTSGEMKTTISPGMESFVTIKSGKIYISNEDRWTYSECAEPECSGGVTIDGYSGVDGYVQADTSEVIGRGSLSVAFKRPAYQVTLTSTDKSVEFYDGQMPGPSAEFLASLSGGSSTTVSVSSGYVSAQWSYSADYRTSDTTGGVDSFSTMGTNYGYSWVSGDGSLTITVEERLDP